MDEWFDNLAENSNYEVPNEKHNEDKIEEDKLSQVLALRDSAQYQLQQIKDVDTGIKYLNYIKGIETWVKAEKKDAQMQNMIAEQKLRTQRILGNLIKECQKKGELATQGNLTGNNQYGNVSNKNISSVKTLSDIGISRKDSSTFQNIASIPDDTFEKVIQEKKSNVDKAVSELTTTGMLKVANELKRKQQHENLEDVEFITGKKFYRVIYADPPWKYNEVQHVDEGNIQSKTLGNHYPSMTIQELCELPVKDITEDNAVLFLWVTSPLLEECFPIISSWGFKYKTSMVWDKVKHNVGNYVSVRHELLLICTKGSCTPDVKKLYDSVITEERTEHSRKPETFREIIDTIYPNGNRIELFARKIEKDGWDTWGNQIKNK